MRREEELLSSDGLDSKGIEKRKQRWNKVRIGE
jgi:hypothetical protein